MFFYTIWHEVFGWKLVGYWTTSNKIITVKFIYQSDCSNILLKQNLPWQILNYCKTNWLSELAVDGKSYLAKKSWSRRWKLTKFPKDDNPEKNTKILHPGGQNLDPFDENSDSNKKSAYQEIPKNLNLSKTFTKKAKFQTVTYIFLFICQTI